MEFGELIHKVLEDFANDEQAKQWTDAARITVFFHHALELRLAQRFGGRLTVPLVVQREAAKQRLAWWAEEEAYQRLSGWQILCAEKKLSPPDEPWVFHTMTVSGRIDRMERHPEQGLRLVDFKTSSPYEATKAERSSAEHYHIKPLSKDGPEPPPWALIGEKRWVDLQLPLYQLAIQPLHPQERITLAHATLGRSKKDIGLSPWQLDEVTLASAKACAEGVIDAIQARRFWPPAERVDYDDFAELFLQDVPLSVDPTLLQAAAR
jgi:ATP-dependent helicase/nuclease subunit B